jgi:hypothetical protein
VTKFQFDGWASLERARNLLPHPNRPNRPNRRGIEGAGLGRLGRLGAGGSSKPFSPVDPEVLADALDCFEERAAIREYEGGQTRVEAEIAAMHEAAETYGIATEALRAAVAAKVK